MLYFNGKFDDLQAKFPPEKQDESPMGLLIEDTLREEAMNRYGVQRSVRNTYSSLAFHASHVSMRELHGAWLIVSTHLLDSLVCFVVET